MSLKALAISASILGLVPFLFFTGVIVLHPSVMLFKLILISYGTLILSFLAGTHWRIAFEANSMAPKYAKWLLVYACFVVTLCLAAIIYVHSFHQLVAFILIVLFTIQMLIDRQLSNHYESWYIKLRVIISFIVVLTLMVGIISPYSQLLFHHDAHSHHHEGTGYHSHSHSQEHNHDKQPYREHKKLGQHEHHDSDDHGHD